MRRHTTGAEDSCDLYRIMKTGNLLSPDEVILSSGHRELLTLKKALMADCIPSRSSVVWYTDSTNLISFWEKGSPSPSYKWISSRRYSSARNGPFNFTFYTCLEKTPGFRRLMSARNLSTRTIGVWTRRLFPFFRLVSCLKDFHSILLPLLQTPAAPGSSRVLRIQAL